MQVDCSEGKGEPEIFVFLAHLFPLVGCIVSVTTSIDTESQACLGLRVMGPFTVNDSSVSEQQS